MTDDMPADARRDLPSIGGLYRLRDRTLEVVMIEWDEMEGELNVKLKPTLQRAVKSDTAKHAYVTQKEAKQKPDLLPPFDDPTHGHGM